MTDQLSNLIQAVDAADSSDLLLDAVEALADACLEGAIPTLIAVLSYNNPGAAVAAVDGLIQLGEPTVSAIMQELDQHNYTARAWAIRALAGIGDPRGLVTLLDAVTTDFSLSVRRAAARGLGMMKWRWFPDNLLEIAQEEVLNTLLFVALQDEEWVVRYATVVGLEAFADTVTDTHPDWRSQTQAQFDQMAVNDGSWAVRARILMAQQHLQSAGKGNSSTPNDQPSPLSTTDWRIILEKLYEHKEKERLTPTADAPNQFENRTYKPVASADAAR